MTFEGKRKLEELCLTTLRRNNFAGMANMAMKNIRIRIDTTRKTKTRKTQRWTKAIETEMTAQSLQKDEYLDKRV